MRDGIYLANPGLPHFTLIQFSRCWMETNTVKRTSCNLTNIFRTWYSRFSGQGYLHLWNRGRILGTWEVLALRMRFPSCENMMCSKLKLKLPFIMYILKKRLSLALVNLLAKVLAILGWNQRKSICWVYMIKFEPKGCNEKVWQAIQVSHFPAATPIATWTLFPRTMSFGA